MASARTKADPRAARPAADPAIDRLMNREEVAVQLGVAYRTLGLMVSAGEFPAPDHHAGRKPLWLRSTVGRYVDAIAARRDAKAAKAGR